MEKRRNERKRYRNSSSDTLTYCCLKSVILENTGKTRNRKEECMYRTGKSKEKCLVILYSKNYSRTTWTGGLGKHKKGSVLYYDRDCTEEVTEEWHTRIMKSGAYKIDGIDTWVEVVDPGVTGRRKALDMWVVRLSSGSLISTPKRPIITSAGYVFQGETIELEPDALGDLVIPMQRPVKAKLVVEEPGL
jgi:hypothetical protein